VVFLPRWSTSRLCALPGAMRETARSTKVLRGFGDASVLEVIESNDSNAYRAVHTVRFAEVVFVLHVFQKKSKSGAETPKA